MTIEADNSLGCGWRLNLTTDIDADEVGLPTALYPGAGMNLARVNQITMIDLPSVNSVSGEIETDGVNGNTLFQINIQASLAMGNVSGSSDEIEDFNGPLAGGYTLQPITLDYADCNIAASALAAMAVGGYVNVSDAMKRVVLLKYLDTGAYNPYDTGSRATLAGSVDESTS